MEKAILFAMFVTFVASQQSPQLVVEQRQGSNVPLAGDKPGDVLPQKLPRFCNGVQCPVFTLLNKTDEYEIRRYPATSWMSTNLKDVSYKKSTYTMFMTLFRYIQGANVAEKKIPMTCPVLNKIIPGPGATCESDFTMSFFNDPAEGAPPAATDNTVFVNKMKAATVYVKSFGGFAKYADYRDNALAMAKALEADGLAGTYITEFYFTAGYDAPYKLFKRHNEVWFMTK